MGVAKTAPVDIRDVAAVASAILTGEAHHGATYNISGPEKLSFADIAQRLSAATGKRIEYRDIAPAEFLNMLIQSGDTRLVRGGSYSVMDCCAARRTDRHGRRICAGKEATYNFRTVCTRLRRRSLSHKKAQTTANSFVLFVPLCGQKALCLFVARR